MTSSHWRRCISALGHEGGILYVLAEVLSREVDDMDIWSTQWVSEKTLVILCIPPLRNYLSCHNQFSSVAQFCLTFCNPMDCSTPGFPVHHQLPELAQTHIHQVGDAIQPSHPLLSPSLWWPKDEKADKTKEGLRMQEQKNQTLIIFPSPML